MVLEGISYVERVLNISPSPLTPHRPRAHLAPILVPHRQRLGGTATYERSNFREHFLPFWLQGRRREALRWMLGHLVPRAEAVRQAGFSGGPRAWRAMRYRAWQFHHRTFRGR